MNSRTPIAFVIPWYGANIPGGAETEVRHLAEHLRADGVDVVVLTTCAREFSSDWANDAHIPGNYVINDVPVKRFSLDPRDEDAFRYVNQKLMRQKAILPTEELIFLKHH